MAVLNKIRQRSVVLIVVIAMALFAFVIGDLFRNSDAFSNSPQDVIATVNGKDMTRNEFMVKVKNYQDRVGGSQTSTQAMNTIYNQELRQLILESEFDKLGLSVETDEIRDLLRTSFSSYPEFQDENGNFDVSRLNAFIANLKDVQPDPVPLGNFQVNYESWTNNEQIIASNAIQQSYYNMIKAGIGTTIPEAKAEYVGEAKTADIKYVQIPYTTIPDSTIQVKKSDVEAYMKENESTYKVDASREIVYVEFEEVASKTDEEAIKANLMSLLEDRAEYNNATENTDTIAGFNTTDDVENFVNANSDLKFQDKYLRKSELPSNIADTLMALSVGENYGPYRDQGYFKITKIIDKEERPDSVKVRHILIPYAGTTRADASVTKTRAEAEATADSIYNVVKDNRSKFVDLLELSSDKVSNEKEGVIEFAYNSSFAPEFKAFSFDNETGAIDVVETSFGFHVIEILDQSNFSSTIKVATLAQQIEPSDATLQDVFNRMSKFEIAVKDADFKEEAQERDLKVKPIVFKELDENIPGLGSQREVVRWAFSDDTSVGEIKNFPIAGFGFIVAKLVEVNDEGLMDVEDASITALPEIRKEKKAELIKEKISASAVSEIAKNQGQSVRTASALTMNNTTLSGAGVEPKVVGTVFGLSEGETSSPIAGEKGVYVLEVVKMNAATELENYTPIMNRLNTTKQNVVQSKVYNALKNAAEIEDNRAKTVY